MRAIFRVDCLICATPFFAAVGAAVELVDHALPFNLKFGLDCLICAMNLALTVLHVPRLSYMCYDCLICAVPFFSVVGAAVELVDHILPFS